MTSKFQQRVYPKHTLTKPPTQKPIWSATKSPRLSFVNTYYPTMPKNPQYHKMTLVASKAISPYHTGIPFPSYDLHKKTTEPQRHVSQSRHRLLQKSPKLTYVPPERGLFPASTASTVLALLREILFHIVGQDNISPLKAVTRVIQHL